MHVVRPSERWYRSPITTMHSPPPGRHCVPVRALGMVELDFWPENAHFAVCSLALGLQAFAHARRITPVVQLRKSYKRQLCVPALTSPVSVYVCATKNNVYATKNNVRSYQIGEVASFVFAADAAEGTGPLLVLLLLSIATKFLARRSVGSVNSHPAMANIRQLCPVPLRSP